MVARKRKLPHMKIVDGELHCTRVDGSKVVFTTIESRARQADRRLEILKRIPKYYTKYGE